MFNIVVPLRQLFLDEFNLRNNMCLTLEDVVLSDPQPSPSSSGDTAVSLTIPVRNTTTIVQYNRWDFTAFYDIHDPHFEVTRSGLYSLSDVLALVNERLLMALTESDFQPGSWQVQGNSTEVVLVAAETNIMLKGQLRLTLGVVVA